MAPSPHRRNLVPQMMRRGLRTEEQGADTIVWLAASEKGIGFTGQYFFDRAPRSTSLFAANTEPTPKEYEDLVQFCEEAK